ncbi:MAG: DUF4870 domain-containing protein [Nitrospiraceae bacterium]|nr:DUF4870 domain-containing protein [Nitrospiraceae bacterium]
MTEEPLMEDPTLQEPDKDARMWAMFTHLSAFAGLTGIPFASIIAPLVIWLMKRDVSPFIDAHGKESVNFQITMGICALVSIVLCFIIVGFFLGFALFVFWLIVTIMAAIKANDGQPYRYPLCIRFIK